MVKRWVQMIYFNIRSIRLKKRNQYINVIYWFRLTRNFTIIIR